MPRINGLVRPSLRSINLTCFVLVAVCAAPMMGCTSMARRGGGNPIATALENPRETRLGRQFLDLAQGHPGLSGFHLTEAGADGLATRVQMVRNAERTLDLQYYIFRADQTGTLLREELRHAADRGVRVRVLVDDVDTEAGDEQLLALDGYPNMQVRVFNPFDYRKHNELLRELDFLFHKSRLDYRMHNKLLVADDAIALIGGRNVGNQYFQLDPQSQFADDDLFSAGPIVSSLSKSFDEFWNSDLVVPAAALAVGKTHAYRPPATTPVVLGSGIDYVARIDSGEPYASLICGRIPLVWAAAQLVYDSPDKRFIEKREKRGRLLSPAVEREIANARTELLMVSPYFVPSDGEIDLLKKLRGENVVVKVLSNSMESTPDLAAQSGYDKVRLPLLKAGVRLFEIRSRLETARGSGQTPKISRYGNYSLHAKLYIADRRHFFIGSWNFDQRSLRINTEIGLLVDSPELASQVARRFDAMTEPSAAYEVVLDPQTDRPDKLAWVTEIDRQKVWLKKEPSRGWWQRRRERLLEILPLQPEL